MIDPRPLYRDASTWLLGVADAVDASALSLPTPCSEFDVRALIGHTVGATRRLGAIGRREDPMAVSVDLPELVDPVGELRAAVAETIDAWSDETRLDEIVTLPWASAPARAIVITYINETLVHGWDLAVATGQPCEADPVLAETILEHFRPALPANHRGAEIPFDAAVTPSPVAGPTERLANWSGHSASGWVR